MTSNPNSKRTESPAAFETFRRFSHAYYAIAKQVLGSVGATTDHVTSYTPLIHSFPCTHASKRSTECRTQLVSNDFYKTIALQNEQKKSSTGVFKVTSPTRSIELSTHDP